MMAHVTAAALASENKALAHPASVDSIPTSASKEDHVSMGPTAARRPRASWRTPARVLAIELLAACQALEFRRPLRSSAALEAVHALVRAPRPGARARRGPLVAPEIEAARRSRSLGRRDRAAEPACAPAASSHDKARAASRDE